MSAPFTHDSEVQYLCSVLCPERHLNFCVTLLMNQMSGHDTDIYIQILDEVDFYYFRNEVTYMHFR